MGLAAVVFGSACSVAAADRAAVEATIHAPGRVVATPAVVTIETLEAKACTRYSGQIPALYGPSGSIQAQPPGPRTWSLATVLECGLVPGVSPAAVTELTVRQLNHTVEAGRGSTLVTADLSATGDFADSAQPLITYDGSNVIYYRPWRGGSDQNYRDKVEEPGPSPLAIDVYEGPPLTVAAHASSATVTAGATVIFSATVSDPAAGASPDPATLSYGWDFDGAAVSSTSASPRETFANAGTYNVTLEVTDTASGGGGAGTTLVTVKPAANTPTAPTPSANAPSTGPAQSSGSTPGGTSGKPNASHGPTTGTKHPAGRPSHTTTSAPAVHPKPARRTTTMPRQPTSSPSATTAPARATTTVQPASHPAAHVSPPVHDPRTGAPSFATGAPAIDGRLISNLAPLPVASSPLVSILASPATAPAVRRAVGASILPVLAAMLTVLLLLGLGAGHQLGWRRRSGTVLLGS